MAGEARGGRGGKKWRERLGVEEGREEDKEEVKEEKRSLEELARVGFPPDEPGEEEKRSLEELARVGFPDDETGEEEKRSLEELARVGFPDDEPGEVMRRVNDGKGNFDFEGVDDVPSDIGEDVNLRTEWVEGVDDVPSDIGNDLNLRTEWVEGNLDLDGVDDVPSDIGDDLNLHTEWVEDNFEPWNRCMSAEDLVEDQRATMHDRAGSEFWGAMDNFLNALNISARRMPEPREGDGKDCEHICPTLFRS
ncbi:hypothetical protein T484DRAFT_1818712 [Baffinella frigidus]|nr:hypothetical protein T484DRAFT_1818712 [Cryptophyta sp. CCMP2293]